MVLLVLLCNVAGSTSTTSSDIPSMSLDDWIKHRENTILAQRRKHLEEMCKKFNLSRSQNDSKTKGKKHFVIVCMYRHSPIFSLVTK